jgi:hypothetical protein
MVLGPFASTTMDAPFGTRQAKPRRKGAKPHQILKHPISSSALAIRYAFTPNTPPTNIHVEKFCIFFNGLGSMVAGSLMNQIRA